MPKENIISKRTKNVKTKSFDPKQQLYVKRMICFINKTNLKYTGPYEVKQLYEDNTAVVTDKKKKEMKIYN